MSRTPLTPHAIGQRFAAMGIIVNTLLAITKLLTGIVGHSAALTADAIESMADIVGSAIIWGGLHIASLPADENHPYGHGKAEPLAALLVALALLGAGAGIAVKAIREMHLPHEPPAVYTLPVLLGVVAIKETMFRVGRRGAKSIDSGAVHVEAWHHRSDAITSAAAAVGISIALIGGTKWTSADEWAALVSAAFIVLNAWHLVHRPMAELMDTEPKELIERVRKIAAGVPEVQGVEKVFARKSGLSYWVDMHIEVDPNMTVHRAHGIAHDVKDAIQAAVPQISNALIHIEPHQPGVRGQRSGVRNQTLEPEP